MKDEFQSALDGRLEEALQMSNYRITLANQLDMARWKLKEQLTISINGGTFNINPTLITFVHMHIAESASSIVLIDVNENPIEINDLPTFLEQLKDTYHEALNDYLIECKRLRGARNTKNVVKV